MKTLVNCTPHPISLLNKDMSILMTLPKGELVPRLIENKSDYLEDNNYPVPLFTKKFGKIENLPNPILGTIFIVSKFVLDAAPDNRTDLVSPGDLVRDSNGNILGCTSFELKCHVTPKPFDKFKIEYARMLTEKPDLTEEKLKIHYSCGIKNAFDFFNIVKAISESKGEFQDLPIEIQQKIYKSVDYYTYWQ